MKFLWTQLTCTRIILMNLDFVTFKNFNFRGLSFFRPSNHFLIFFFKIQEQIRTPSKFMKNTSNLISRNSNKPCHEERRSKWTVKMKQTHGLGWESSDHPLAGGALSLTIDELFDVLSYFRPFNRLIAGPSIYTQDRPLSIDRPLLTDRLLSFWLFLKHGFLKQTKIAFYGPFR